MERWRFFGLTTLLSVLFLAGLFAMGELGRARLKGASEQMQTAMGRRILIGELRQHVAEAALASRSLLVTGRPEYLDSLRDAARQIDSHADTLVLSYAGTSDVSLEATVRQLRYLAGVQTGAIMSLVALYTSSGAAAAAELAKAQSSTIDPIHQFLDVAEQLERHEAARVREAREHWRQEQSLARRLGVAGMVVNILLVLSASLLAVATLRRHREAMQQVARRRDELEVEAATRAAELNEVYGHLQSVQELERSRLARGLHDELGGLLLAARMDVTWVQQHARDGDAQALGARIDRILEALDQGIDLKRRVIEELRPTLLDNMGLLAALRWQVDETCRRAGLHCACHFPADEPDIASRTAIALFRVVQEALTNVLKHASATRVDLTLGVTADHLLLTVADDGTGIAADRLGKTQSHGLAGMKHRVVALGGTLTVGAAPGGGTEVRAIVPRGPRPDGARPAALRVPGRTTNATNLAAGR
ncbi:MAG TPA: ATP-binding protein [Steroidobacteraceae bacterium]|nr:ATP-binding protein [Steroidobacteraceae bacterium]